MSDNDLAAIYRAYLACLNDRRWDDLGEYVADDVVRNGERLELSGYRAMLEADTQAIPDLRFNAEILIADERHVACRLVFTCTPQQEFLGRQPNGEQVTFAEHVFYRFENRRIAQVWSVIDKEAVREGAHECQWS